MKTTRTWKLAVATASTGAIAAAALTGTAVAQPVESDRPASISLTAADTTQAEKKLRRESSFGQQIRVLAQDDEAGSPAQELRGTSGGDSTEGDSTSSDSTSSDTTSDAVRSAPTSDSPRSARSARTTQAEQSAPSQQSAPSARSAESDPSGQSAESAQSAQSAPTSDSPRTPRTAGSQGEDS